MDVILKVLENTKIVNLEFYIHWKKSFEMKVK